MAITPHCCVSSCGKELDRPGAVLISPPTCGENGEYASNVVKIHICHDCFRELVDSFGLQT